MRLKACCRGDFLIFISGFKIKPPKDKILKTKHVSPYKASSNELKSSSNLQKVRLMTTYRNIVFGSVKVGEQVTIQIQSLLSKYNKYNSLW